MSTVRSDPELLEDGMLRFLGFVSSPRRTNGKPRVFHYALGVTKTKPYSGPYPRTSVANWCASLSKTFSYLNLTCLPCW
jgi:hypothetical protein